MFVLRSTAFARATGLHPDRGRARRSFAEAPEFIVQQLHADADEFDELGVRLLVVLFGFVVVDLDLGHRRQVTDDLADLFGKLVDVGDRVRAKAIEKPLAPVTQGRGADRDGFVIVRKQQLEFELSRAQRMPRPLENGMHRRFGAPGKAFGVDFAQPVLQGHSLRGAQRTGQRAMGLREVGEGPRAGHLTFDLTEIGGGHRRIMPKRPRANGSDGEKASSAALIGPARAL